MGFEIQPGFLQNRFLSGGSAEQDGAAAAMAPPGLSCVIEQIGEQSGGRRILRNVIFQIQLAENDPPFAPCELQKRRILQVEAIFQQSRPRSVMGFLNGSCCHGAAIAPVPAVIGGAGRKRRGIRGNHRPMSPPVGQITGVEAR